MRRSSRRFTKRWGGDIPKAALAVGAGAPADVVVRLLILKHVRNWSYAVLEREVRANLVYRDFPQAQGPSRVYCAGRDSASALTRLRMAGERQRRWSSAEIPNSAPTGASFQKAGAAELR
jgi:hypothetical protein